MQKFINIHYLMTHAVYCHVKYSPSITHLRNDIAYRIMATSVSIIMPRRLLYY